MTHTELLKEIKKLVDERAQAVKTIVAMQQNIDELKIELQEIYKEACLLEDDVTFAGSGYYNVCASHADTCDVCKEEIELMENAPDDSNLMRAYRNSLLPAKFTTSIDPNFDWHKAWELRRKVK